LAGDVKEESGCLYNGGNLSLAELDEFGNTFNLLSHKALRFDLPEELNNEGNIVIP
jgi:hypothetical protein